MRNYVLFLLLILSTFSCKKSDETQPINPAIETKTSYQIDSSSTQPGLFLTLKASRKITRDTLTTSIGRKSIFLFKVDSVHYAFWVPVIDAGTYTLNLRGVNAEKNPEVVIRDYVAITNPDAVIAEIISGYNTLADSLEMNSYFNKNATKNAAFIRQLIQQVNQNLTKITSEERQLLAYHFQFNKADLSLFQSQVIDTTYLVSRLGEDRSLDISQQAVDKLTQFEAKKIEAIIEGKKALIIYGAMYFALPNPVLLGALSVGAAIQTAHFLSLVDEASELCTQPMNTAFQAFDGMQEENGNGTVSNAILTNSYAPIEFRYIVKFKTLQKADESSAIQSIATAIKAAYELEENGHSIKSTFEDAKRTFSALFDKITVSFTPFVSPVLLTAKEKFARIKSRFISVTNVSNPQIVATAVDDGNNGLKVTFSNPSNNITTQTNFTFQVTYTQTAINNKVSITQNAKFIPLAVPSITTVLVRDITATSASSGGIITSDGGATVSAKGVCYSTSPNPTVTDKTIPHGTAAGTFVSSITDLVPNTIYYLKAYATNSIGTGYGNEISFRTLPLAKPVLTTSSVTSITRTTAVSGGNITSDGGSAVSSRGVCWSTFQNPTISDERTFNSAGSGSFVSELKDLVGNKMYYVRAYATNGEGTAYGNEIHFQTEVDTFTYNARYWVPATIVNSGFILRLHFENGIVTGRIPKAINGATGPIQKEDAKVTGTYNATSMILVIDYDNGVFPTATQNGEGGRAEKWTITGVTNADHSSYTATYERKTTSRGGYFTNGQWVPTVQYGTENGNFTY